MTVKEICDAFLVKRGLVLFWTDDHLFIGSIDNHPIPLVSIHQCRTSHMNFLEHCPIDLFWFMSSYVNNNEAYVTKWLPSATQRGLVSIFQRILRCISVNDLQILLFDIGFSSIIPTPHLFRQKGSLARCLDDLKIRRP